MNDKLKENWKKIWKSSFFHNCKVHCVNMGKHKWTIFSNEDPLLWAVIYKDFFGIILKKHKYI